MTLGQRKLKQNSSWQEVRKVFISYFIGNDDRMKVKKPINRTIQKEKESITVSMPRLLRLIQLVDPGKPEDESVEAIKERLAMLTIETLDELNSLSRRVEAGFTAERDVTRRETLYQGKDKKRTNKSSSDKSKRTESRNKTSNKELVCYRCDRKGHIAPNGRMKTEEDGSECRPYMKKS